jgi:hypothetical protein
MAAPTRGCAWAAALKPKVAATVATAIKDRNGATTALTFDARLTCPIALSSLLPSIAGAEYEPAIIADPRRF